MPLVNVILRISFIHTFIWAVRCSSRFEVTELRAPERRWSNSQTKIPVTVMRSDTSEVTLNVIGQESH